MDGSVKTLFLAKLFRLNRIYDKGSVSWRMPIAQVKLNFYFFVSLPQNRQHTTQNFSRLLGILTFQLK